MLTCRIRAPSILPPSKDRSLWRVTTTKTFEVLSGQPKYRYDAHGAQQRYEALLKKHAIEYTKLMTEFEEWTTKEQEDMKSAGAEKKTEPELKEKDRKDMLEQIIFNLAKEMAGRAEEKRKEGEASMPKADQGKFEDKSADTGKKAEIEEKKSEWKGMIEHMLVNVANNLVRSSGQKDGKSFEERRKEEAALTPKVDQRKFIAQLLDLSRIGTKP